MAVSSSSEGVAVEAKKDSGAPPSPPLTIDGSSSAPNNTTKTSTQTPPKSSLDTSSAHNQNLGGNVDETAEFTGNVNTNDEIPSQAVLKKIEDYSVLDKDGRTIPFKSLYTGPNSARRVLIIFIRHFFCGQCQEYLRSVSASITEDSLLQLSIPTFIAVVGCGNPALIPMYQETTSCPFPIYADPSKRLYNELGMTRTLNLGTRPDYIRNGLMSGVFKSMVQSLRHLKGGMVFQGGDYQQVGGEFLFEPVDISTPICSPAGGDENKQLGANAGAEQSEEKRVTWCHRMRNTRDHVEIPELREILGLDGVGKPGANTKRWSKAVKERKGTGFSEYSSKVGSVSENSGSARQSVEKTTVNPST
ncbi:hypothetical protein BP6252_03101 [Coleophoma cylindrospora]|uniref:Uncharacterized protein n=1 Tax=Coleophoma cylindrospora TaxID=1849047 RepID=A0A3D8S6R7_9HELO|nr:hypothetical protein BP6252_03101 [Coleophoma cylindrospora]